MSSRKQLQTGELIKRNFGLVLQQEGRYIYDSQILVSVTNVLMSPDLGLAKIYLSIFNADDKNAVLTKVNASKHRLKQQLTHRIRKHVRRIPNIDLYVDETLDEMYKINSMFDELKENKD